MPPKRCGRGPTRSGGSAAVTANTSQPVGVSLTALSGGASPSSSAKNPGSSAPLNGGAVSSPTGAQLHDQQLLQQQVYQHQLQLLRLAQQQRPTFPLAEVGRTGFMFAVALVAMYLVFKDYGWALTAAFAALLYMCGLFRFLSVLARWFFKTVDSVSYSDALRRADIMTAPIVKKVTHTGENATLNYGCSCMQGWRRTMEDAHTTLTFDDGGFFAVYDGHSGAATSKFCGTNLYDFIAGTSAFKEKNYPTALYDGFIAIDRHLLANHGADRSGCTAVVLFIKGDELFCANAGDSRCVLCRDGEAFPMSTDHKPFLPSEQFRIERAGGYIWARRVNGTLALSRAIGDFGFKQNAQVSWDQQAVTSAPEVRSTRLNRDKDEFAVIACDGIWDVMTNEQVIEFVRTRVQERMPLGKICELLMDACLAPQAFGLGCDNMSVIIVQFKRTTQGVGSTLVAVGTAVANERAHSHGSGTSPRSPPTPSGIPKVDALTEPTALLTAPQSVPPQTKELGPTALCSPPQPPAHPSASQATGATAMETTAAPNSEAVGAGTFALEALQLPNAHRQAPSSSGVATSIQKMDSPDAAGRLGSVEGDNVETKTPIRTPRKSTTASVSPLHAEEEVNYVGGGGGTVSGSGSETTSPAATLRVGRNTASGATTPNGRSMSPTVQPPVRGVAGSDGRKHRSTPSSRNSNSVSELEQLKHAVNKGLL